MSQYNVGDAVLLKRITFAFFRNQVPEGTRAEIVAVENVTTSPHCYRVKVDPKITEIEFHVSAQEIKGRSS